jgi:ankyrin repeat protein
LNVSGNGSFKRDEALTMNQGGTMLKFVRTFLLSICLLLPVLSLAQDRTRIAEDAATPKSAARPDEGASESKNLLGAVYENNEVLVRELLHDPEVRRTQVDPQCPPNIQCKRKPLAIAADNGSVEITKLLLNAGADINGRGGATGDTPLIYAVGKKHVELTKLLLDRGADPNLPNYFGATPFWVACGLGFEEGIPAMLAHAADLNYSGRFPEPINGKRKIVQGITPLMVAARYGHTSVVRLLLRAGADANRLDSEGRSATDYAELGGDAATKDLMTKARGGQ